MNTLTTALRRSTWPARTRLSSQRRQNQPALDRAVHRGRLRQWSGRSEGVLCMSAAKPRPVAGSSAVESQKVETMGVMFVCLGNICRSPTAEAVFRSVVEQRGLASRFVIDSCGTGGGNPSWYRDGGWSYHEGDPADERMKIAAQQRGIVLTSKSRPLRVSDLKEFDLFVAMDRSNIDKMKTAIQHWALKDATLKEALNRIVLMTDFCQNEDFKERGEVPDPYYGGRRGFDRVLDLLIDACDGLVAHLSDGGGVVRR